MNPSPLFPARRIALPLALGLLALAAAFALYHFALDPSRRVTFAQCHRAGGTPWRVDIGHPDICPACAEYRACQAANPGQPSGLAAACPQGPACAGCMRLNFPYPQRCPGGQDKIGTISDAATWFLCCR